MQSKEERGLFWKVGGIAIDLVDKKADPSFFQPYRKSKSDFFFQLGAILGGPIILEGVAIYVLAHAAYSLLLALKDTCTFSNPINNLKTSGYNFIEGLGLSIYGVASIIINLVDLIGSIGVTLFADKPQLSAPVAMS